LFDVEPFLAGYRAVSNNGSGSGLAPAQNVLQTELTLETNNEIRLSLESNKTNSRN